MRRWTALRQALRSGDLESWAPHALALFFGWGGILVALSCLLPGREHPEVALGASAAAVATAVVLVRGARRSTRRTLSLTLALGTTLIALVVLSSGRTTSPDALLFVWVGLHCGFFLGAGRLAVHVAFVTVLYAVVLLLHPGAGGTAPQHLLLVTGAVTAAGIWSLALRMVAEALVERHRALASTDPLSGLANRTELLRRGQDRLAAAEPDSLVVLLIDLDDFKLVNDELGHGAGDELLRDAARRLERVARSTDLVARLGGDEFAVLADGADARQGAAIAERAIEALTRPYQLGDDLVMVGASVGLATADHHDRFADLLRNADAAMYAAKRDGGGWRTFTPSMRAEIAQRRAFVRELESALDGQLSLRYQPIADVADGRVEAVEALVRWEHPTRGLVPPDGFIPVAERTGLIVELGRWVLREACERAVAWAASTGATPVVSVNLSPRQLLDDRLAEDVARTLAETGHPAERLMLEITESSVMVDADLAVTRLRALRDLGVRLAIDDFGTGHSSLAYLQRLPVTDLKLARDFVGHLDDDPADHALARGIIALGHELGLRVIAEGVELESQLEHLRAMGCDLVQGYLLDRPLDGDDLERRLSAQGSSLAGNGRRP